MIIINNFVVKTIELPEILSDTTMSKHIKNFINLNFGVNALIEIIGVSPLTFKLAISPNENIILIGASLLHYYNVSAFNNGYNALLVSSKS